MARRSLALALLVMTLLAAPAAVADWPVWLGPTRNAVSTETGIMHAWTDTVGPKWVWKRKVGHGFSAISAVGDRLYSMYADGDHEYVICLQRADGKTLWQAKIHEDVYSDAMGGDGPRATPTVDGSAVYALGANGTLVALAATDGAIRWKRELAGEFGGDTPQWGYSGSPLLHGGRLFIDVGGPDGHGLMAFDAKSGEVVWHTENVIKAGYSSPLAYTVGGVEQIVFFTGRQIVSVDPAHGEAHWRLPWSTSWDVNAATPLFLPPDRLFISSGYGTGGALYQLSAADGRVAAKQLWKNKVMKNKMATSVPVGGYLYGISGTELTCMEIATGKELWSTDDVGWGSVMAADGHLLVLTEECALLLVEANPERYVEKGRRQAFDDRCWTLPTLHDGVLYLRDEAAFEALDLRPASPR